MDDIVETLWGFTTLAAAIALVSLLAIGIFALGMSVLVAGVPIGGAYVWYWNRFKSEAAQERQARERTYELYRSVKARVAEIDPQYYFTQNLAITDDDANGVRFRICARLVMTEGLDNFPEQPPPICNSIEGGKYRDHLNSVVPEDFEAKLAQIATIANLASARPTPELIAGIVNLACEERANRALLPATALQISKNFAELGMVPIVNYDGDDLIWDYLKFTGIELMAEIEHAEESVQIPDHLRTQHMMLLGGTGHGKTQCLQEMILKDLEDEDACVVVIDSQEGMLERLLHVAPWERVMYLDAGNIERPLAMSAFAIGSTTKPEDEPRVRMATALYEHMFASRETKFTTKQQTLYRFLSRLLFVIPDANFDTALDILENGYEPYEDHVSLLNETEQSFVRGNLDNPKVKGASQGYKQTRQEVAQRLYTLLESTTISRMFNAPENKVDIPKAIRDDRVILVNTAQQTLGLEGATLFGRYCIAQIAMEVLARPETRKRVYFYIDEAQEYLSGDPIIHRLFEQGRKRGLCMICAFHRLGQIGEDLTDMMRSLTSIKLAGGISNADASKLAKEMKTDAETIMNHPELSFWAWFKGEEPGVYRVTPQALENRIHGDEDATDDIKSKMLDEHHYDPDWDLAGESEDETGAEKDIDGDASDDTPDFDSYYTDDWGEDDPKPETGKKMPPKADGDDDIDPDAPQDLD